MKGIDVFCQDFGLMEKEVEFRSLEVRKQAHRT
jgi:hypothetical protein